VVSCETAGEMGRSLFRRLLLRHAQWPPATARPPWPRCAVPECGQRCSPATCTWAPRGFPRCPRACGRCRRRSWSHLLASCPASSSWSDSVRRRSCRFPISLRKERKTFYHRMCIWLVIYFTGLRVEPVSFYIRKSRKNSLATWNCIFIFSKLDTIYAAIYSGFQKSSLNV